MKITNIRTFVVNRGEPHPWGTGNSLNWVYVKVYTDSGVDGLGEAFHSLDEPIVAAVEKMARTLVGRDPARIIHNWLAIYRGFRYPLGTAELSALSAIEQALWDIKGKMLGVPVHTLLGGPARDRIRVYASGRYFGGDSLEESARAIAAAGFSALKFGPHPPDYGNLSPEAVLKKSVERVRAVRETVGPDMDICLDYHGRSFSPIEAVKLAIALEPYNIFFLEEPALAEFPDSLCEAKAKTNVAIAAGERCVSRDVMREVIAKRAVHIIQPEPTANGGILETVKLAAMAELHHIVVAPHQACGPVSLMVCAHIDAAIPNFLIQELNVRLDHPVATEILRGIPEVKDGFLEIPSKPGLGIELDEEAALRHPGEPYDRPIITGVDGSIGLE
jgi:galactonate dehydratase